MNIQPSRLIAACPLCQASYQDGAIRLVGEKGAHRMFHCSCRQCGHAILAVVLETSGWVSSIGVMTDLEAKDALRLQESTPITSDECIKYYHIFEQESAVFCKELLQKPSA